MYDRLVAVYPTAADPVRAVAMRAYMRDQFPFLGIPSGRRRALSRDVLTGLPGATGRATAGPGEEDLRAVALACWQLPAREYQYFAVDWLERHAARCSAGFLDTVGVLVSNRPWWDTVDALAGNVVGSIVSRYPDTLSTMDAWLAGDDMWRTRVALLHQLRYKERTDVSRLFRYCLARAGHRDFFIRKAIGWALRQYAWTAPDTVRRFVAQNGAQLSPLSVREAMKNL